MYYVDKKSSLFTGKPPLLTKQYCHCPMPLDLSEDELYGGPDALASAIFKLDETGWNTQGMIHTATWLRAQSLLSPITESILEMSIGFNIECTETTVKYDFIQICCLQEFLLIYLPAI